MRLEKFYVGSMSEALVKIQERLGSEAIIYSQTVTEKGLEVVAGVTKHEKKLYEPKIPSTTTNKIESLSIMERLTDLDQQSIQSELLRFEKMNLLQHKLRKLNFMPEFIEQCSQNYAMGADKESILNNELIIKILLAKIPVKEYDSIDKRKLCALIGPTGIGKSTTIAKLAKRFISKYGSNKLGIISTDFQRIINKNQFHYFGKLLNIHVEYARNAKELKESINILKHKQLILVDTAGIGPNDHKKLAELLDNTSSETSEITTYLVLPCTLQSDILNEVILKFRMSHTAGCIITKKDETNSIAPCLSLAILHQLPIAYLCNGQNISSDIHIPTKIQLINDVFHGEKSDRGTTIPV